MILTAKYEYITKEKKKKKKKKETNLERGGRVETIETLGDLRLAMGGRAYEGSFLV